MSDWPDLHTIIPPGVINIGSPNSLVHDAVVMNRTAGASTAWPAANRALYIPFFVEIPVTVFQIGWRNGATVNNTANDMDVGIYDRYGNRIVRQGGTITQTPISVVQLSDITDTTLNPGIYFMAMCVSNTTGTYNRVAASAPFLQVCGVQQQAVGAVNLPDPATFANPASAFIPWMALAIKATI